MIDAHNPVLLVQSDACSVAHCRDCGTIHRHVGAASVRIPPARFAALCETLLSALSGIPELDAEIGPFPRNRQA